VNDTPNIGWSKR